MKLIIRSAVLFLGLILTCIAVEGCFLPYTHDKVEMVTQIYHAIPITYGDLYELKCEVIETDKYGRKIFAFSTSSWNGYCISQKTDESYAYYYDNVSFQLEDKRLSVLIDEYDPEDLDEFRINNDWDKELDESKMVKKIFVKATELARSRESMIGRETVTKLLNNAFEDKHYKDYDSFFCDYSQTGQELFYIQGAPEYLLILNADGAYDPENGLIKIDDWDNINSLLAEIKEKNGWEG